MVWLNTHLDNLASKLTAEDLDAVVNFLTYHALQQSVPVFWYPHDMILTMPYGM
jgi:hypothetical protein